MVSEPENLTVDGRAGKKIILEMAEDVDAEGDVFSGCDDDKFALLGVQGEDPGRWSQGKGQVEEVWAVDVDGAIAVLIGNYYPGTPAVHVDEVRETLASMTFVETSRRRESRTATGEEARQGASLGSLRRGIGHLQQRSNLSSSALGAGGNRTPVRRAVAVRHTTIPGSRHYGWRTAGSEDHAEVVAARSFPEVSGLSHRQRSLPAVRHCFCCRAAVARPRAPLPVTVCDR